MDSRLNSSLWHLDVMVTGILWGAVVASMKITWGGGSSRVLRRALNASWVSMWTSSIMYTLNLPMTGRYLTLSLRLRISSMPRFDAASISMTSTELPPEIAWHDSHVLHGSEPWRLVQFTDLASSLATVVLPVPLGPEKRYAWDTLFSASAFCRILITGFLIDHIFPFVGTPGAVQGGVGQNSFPRT